MYCLLYIARSEDSSKGSGFVDLDQIQQLGGWEKTSRLSAGKQIRRHMQALARRGLAPIEGEQKTAGPFRVSGAEMSCDVSIDALKAFLFGSTVDPLKADEADRFYRYVDQMAAGALRLDDGTLEKALATFEKAAQYATRPYLEAIALQNAARILERLGRYEEAADIASESFEALGRSRQYRHWGEARTLAIQGQLCLRVGRIDDAEKVFRKALALVRGTSQLRVLGEIYNGLGNISAAREQYHDALACYQQALEHWILVENLYGIQALYFNIGKLYLLWGGQLRTSDARRTSALYKVARRWLEQCVRLCHLAGTGYDDNDAEIGLASIHRHFGEFPEALARANEAMTIATSAGNVRGIRNAYRCLLKLHIAMKNLGEAEKLLADARVHLEETYFKPLEALLKESKQSGRFQD